MQFKLVTIYLSALASLAAANPLPESNPAPIAEAGPEPAMIVKRCVGLGKTCNINRGVTCCGSNLICSKKAGQGDGKCIK